MYVYLHACNECVLCVFCVFGCMWFGKGGGLYMSVFMSGICLRVFRVCEVHDLVS